MMPSILVPLLVLTGFFPHTNHADDYPKNYRIDIVNYRFELDLRDTDDILRATATIDARFVSGGDSILRLDLIRATDDRAGLGMIVGLVSERGQKLEYRHVDDQLFINLGRSTMKGEFVRVRIEYRGRAAEALRIGPNKHGDRTIFSDNWPNRARHWLPTVDHPYDKATSEMVVTAPAHYQVVSNGLMLEKRDLGDGRRLTHWKQSVPIATWLYVIGAAEFAVQHLPACVGVPIQTWVAHQDRDDGFDDFAEPTCDALEFFSTRIGPYSYEKLANIVSPSVGGGMEAASAILYGERSITGERAVNWQNVVVHEIAHQWFGNAVTESDWDDVWLSEGFATYFTLLYREYARGRDDFVVGLKDSRERIKAFYDERPNYRIVHDNLTDMSQVTTGMTYQKGAWVLHMLREQIGTATFWEGIKEYHQRYRDQNATTADFRRVMEEVSGSSLKAFFDQWLRRGGIPNLTVAWSYDPDAGEVVVEISQSESQPFLLSVEVEVVDSLGERSRGMVVLGDDGKGELRMPIAERPVSFLVDPKTNLLARWNLSGSGMVHDQPST